MPVYETGLLSRRDGAIRVILPSPEAQAPKLAGRAPAQARKTTEVIEHMLPAPQRVSRLRSWLYHERPPPVTPEPVFRTASYADASRGATYHVMSQVVRGSSLRAVPASESDGTSDPQRAVAQGGGRGGRSSLPALSRDAAPRARRQPRQRSKLYGERTDELREEVKWKLHAGCDPLMSTEEILALGKLDESEEQLVQSVMAQQAGEETFCTWLLNRPLLEHVLGKTTHLLQNSLDSLAEATVFAVERRGKQLQVRSRSDWSGDFSLPERFLANCAVLCGAVRMCRCQSTSGCSSREKRLTSQAGSSTPSGKLTGYIATMLLLNRKPRNTSSTQTYTGLGMSLRPPRTASLWLRAWPIRKLSADARSSSRRRSNTLTSLNRCGLIPSSPHLFRGLADRQLLSPLGEMEGARRQTGTAQWPPFRLQTIPSRYWAICDGLLLCPGCTASWFPRSLRPCTLNQRVRLNTMYVERIVDPPAEVLLRDGRAGVGFRVGLLACRGGLRLFRELVGNLIARAGLLLAQQVAHADAD